MTAIVERAAEAWAVAACLQLLLWLIQQRTKNGGIVDVGWAGSFSLVIALFAARATAPAISWAPLAVVAMCWSVRLTGYLVSRGAATGPEEGRYVDLRARWGPHASAKFFVFFQAQAALTGLLSLAFATPFLESPHADWDWLRYAGAALAALGVLGESLADFQLARFKRANKGRVCNTGLWSWSRHPNYFFEWCVWLGYAIHGLDFWPYGAIAIVPQAIIFASIWFVTGISPTENQALRSKGDAYRAYQARVSKFFPWPPKRS